MNLKVCLFKLVELLELQTEYFGYYRVCSVLYYVGTKWATCFMLVCQMLTNFPRHFISVNIYDKQL